MTYFTHKRSGRSMLIATKAHYKRGTATVTLKHGVDSATLGFIGSGVVNNSHVSGEGFPA